MDHIWKVLPQDYQFPNLKDYQCVNCGSYKVVNQKYENVIYSEIAFDSEYITENIRSCAEIIMESIME